MFKSLTAILRLEDGEQLLGPIFKPCTHPIRTKGKSVVVTNATTQDLAGTPEKPCFKTLFTLACMRLMVCDEAASEQDLTYTSMKT